MSHNNGHPSIASPSFILAVLLPTLQRLVESIYLKIIHRLYLANIDVQTPQRGINQWLGVSIALH